MHRSVGFRVVFGIVCAAAAGCAPGPESATVETEATSGREAESCRLSEGARRPFLWEVRATEDGGRGPSYLMGTMHIGVSLDEALPSGLRAPLDEADVVVVETDLDAIPKVEIARLMVLPEGQSLRSMLPNEVWPPLVALLEGQFPEAVLDRLKPWVVLGAVIGTRLLGEQEEPDGSDSTQPGEAPPMLDREIIKAARAKQTTVKELETPKEQVDYMESLPKPFVVESIRELVLEGQSELDALLVAAYRAGDVEAAQCVLRQMMVDEAAGPVFEKLLFERNERWLPEVEQLVNRGGAFIAVGLAHLLTDRGLVAVLRQRGYTVRRLER